MDSEFKIRQPITDLNEFNINTVIIDNINLNILPFENITKYFWFAHPVIQHNLSRYLDKFGIKDKVIDVGCGDNVFKNATHVVDLVDGINHDRVKFKIDLDFDRIPADNLYFNFLYCRHTLEDIQNPQHAFNELCRISPRGYIETPSPLIELSKSIDSFGNYRGYSHHRYIVWSDITTNTLYFLPKYPIIEHIIHDKYLEKLYNHIANNYPLYWNNYYIWDDNTHPPKIVVFRNGINMNIRKDYSRLLNEAIHKSIEYTNAFISFIMDK